MSTDLFSSFKLGDLTLANRIIMAPLTRNRAAAGNVPQAMNVDYYCQRANAGLIITEASQVSPEGVGYPATPGIYSDAQVAGWRKVTDAVHNEGADLYPAMVLRANFSPQLATRSTNSRRSFGDPPRG